MPTFKNKNSMSQSLYSICLVSQFTKFLTAQIIVHSTLYGMNHIMVNDDCFFTDDDDDVQLANYDQGGQSQRYYTVGITVYKSVGKYRCTLCSLILTIQIESYCDIYMMIYITRDIRRRTTGFTCSPRHSG